MWIKSKLTHTKGMRISVMHHIHQRGRNCVSEALDDGSKAGNSNDNVVCIINNIKACQEVSKALRKLSLMNPHRSEGFCKLELLNKNMRKFKAYFHVRCTRTDGQI